MNVNTLISAVIAALIGFGSGAMALLTQDTVHQVADIEPLSWYVLALGSLMSFLKDFQTIATRALASRVTRRPLAPSKYYPAQEGQPDDEIATLSDDPDTAGDGPDGPAGGMRRDP